MAFVQFTGVVGLRGVQPTPLAVVNAKDEIRFNRPAVQSLAIEKVTHVTAHWDGDAEVMALMPCKENAAHAIPMRFI